MPLHALDPNEHDALEIRPFGPRAALETLAQSPRTPTAPPQRASHFPTPAQSPPPLPLPQPHPAAHLPRAMALLLTARCSAVTATPAATLAAPRAAAPAHTAPRHRSCLPKRSTSVVAASSSNGAVSHTSSPLRPGETPDQAAARRAKESARVEERTKVRRPCWLYGAALHPLAPRFPPCGATFLSVGDGACGSTSLSSPA